MYVKSNREKMSKKTCCQKKNGKMQCRKSGSLKFSGKPGKKDSIKIDSIPQALDIRLLHLDCGVINEGVSTRVRSWTEEGSLVCVHRSRV